MNQFEFSLTREYTLNHLYEYIISQSCEFFGVPNKEVTYSIMINDDSFMMLVFNDEDYDIVESLDTDCMAFTDNYKNICLAPTQQNLIRIYQGYVCLNRGELRYIKFDWKKILDEVAKMFYTMANNCLNLKSHDGELSYDSVKDEFFYRGFFNTQKHIKRKKLVNLTEQMKKCWY